MVRGVVLYCFPFVISDTRHCGTFYTKGYKTGTLSPAPFSPQNIFNINFVHSLSYANFYSYIENIPIFHSSDWLTILSQTKHSHFYSSTQKTQKQDEKSFSPKITTSFHQLLLQTAFCFFRVNFPKYFFLLLFSNYDKFFLEHFFSTLKLTFECVFDIIQIRKFILLYSTPLKITTSI